ncbi:hypothetical protein IMSHALPRED_002840 [Imshaugia aleurites]|uniref:Uncharacterized protein n=1 Tax=Imshaugia aleurites TaxID=172621 RepID=A0A8H3PIM1_9LECA|nr:hypothetical protein IMSHALPRED_002840 [Imshaugia aleurites]
MASFRSNATKAEVRAKLPKQDVKKDNDDWVKFEVDSTYLWKTQISLDTTTSWSSLRAVDKDAALSILEKQCGGISPIWGDLKRPVLEWRLYNLHRSAVKAEGRRQASAGMVRSCRLIRRILPTSLADTAHKVAPMSKPPTAMYDPVREASRDLRQQN